MRVLGGRVREEAGRRGGGVYITGFRLTDVVDGGRATRGPVEETEDVGPGG